MLQMEEESKKRQEYYEIEKEREKKIRITKC